MSYQLALDVARKAERAYRYELGVSNTSFVRSTHWDSLRKGLLAGEKLQYDLDRMEMAYIDGNIRELELTRHVSLSRLDPVSLELLRQNGECWVEIPEALFDLDCPGHYFRRLMSVAVTVACVSGAQRQVNLRLTLTGAKLRRAHSADLLPDSIDATPSIVTSAAIEDPGLFSTEMGGERYQPFERRGAVSSWHLRFCNQDVPQIDWSTISDVIMHLRYTARDGGDDFRTSVSGGVLASVSSLLGGRTSGGNPSTVKTTTGLVVGVHVRRDQPDAFHVAKQGSADLEVAFGTDRLPYFAVGLGKTVTAIYVIAKGVTMSNTVGSKTQIELDDNGAADISALPLDWPGTGSSLAELDSPASTAWPDKVTVRLQGGSDWSTATDVFVLVEYELSTTS